MHALLAHISMPRVRSHAAGPHLRASRRLRSAAHTPLASAALSASGNPHKHACRCRLCKAQLREPRTMH
jgi:hypothetical protein